MKLALPKILALFPAAGALYAFVSIHGQVEHRDERIVEMQASIDRLTASHAINVKYPTSRHTTLAGEEIEIGPHAGGTYVLFFSTECPTCHEQAPQWKRDIEAAEAGGARVIAVASGEEASAFVVRYGLELPVIEDSEHELMKAMNVLGTPSWVYLDDFGRVAMRDSQIVMHRSKSTDLFAAMADWPEGLADAMLLAMGQHAFEGVESLARLPMGEGAGAQDELLVFEGPEGVRGFALWFSEDVLDSASSDLRAWALFDPEGQLVDLLPTAPHSSRLVPLDRAELSRWSERRGLGGEPEAPLQRTLRRRVRAARELLQS